MTAVDETEEAAPRTRSFYLVYSLPERATVRVLVEDGGEVTFGRSDAGDVDVVIDDARVSRRHAVVGRAGAGMYVRDLGSRNGTAVSGEALHDATRGLGAGDVLEIGPMRVVVAAASSRCVVADPGMRKVHAAARRLAQRKAPVLLLGENGVGKALLAEQMHDASGRADGPFVRVDCGARGDPFAVAEGSKKTLVEAADTGTLFLAEVGELSAASQARLFELLQARTLETGVRPGAPVDVRVVCSSSADLHAEAASGRFLPRLYALLGTLSVTVPPLRERTIEIPVLVEHFLRELAPSFGTTAPALLPEAMERLVQHPWPRNASDLRDVLEVALALSDDGRITSAQLPAAFARGSAASIADPAAPSAAGQKTSLSLSRDGDVFRLGESPEVSLARRGSLRRVLLRLVQHREAPGGVASLSADELFAAGWPGERAVAQSSEGRLRTAIWTLRRMGFHDALVTRDDGYLLAPSVEIAWRD